MTLLFPELPADHPAQNLHPDAMRGNNSKFEAKLNFGQRCAVLALYRRNVSVRMLAAAFGINRRTVTHVITPDSARYRNVRDEEKRLGTAEFMAKYITEEVATRLAEAASKPEITEPYDQYDAKPAAERTGVASPRATGSAGITTIKLPHHEFSHRIEVSWLEADTAEDDDGPFEHPAGWYWRDLDADKPERWNGDPEQQTHLTSAKALQHAKVAA